jgi:hypothetical protein
MDNSLDTEHFNIPDYSFVLSKLLGQISQAIVILQGLSRDFGVSFTEENLFNILDKLRKDQPTS